MKIKIWGCRGSIPTPGEYTNKYGGNTTCIEVRLNDGHIIIFDAGSGIRNLGQKLVQEQGINELFLILTHAHWDHLLGFPFFLPAYRSNYTIHVRGGPIAKEVVRSYLEEQMTPPYFPVPFSYLKAEFDFTHGIPAVKKIGDAEVLPIPLSHPNGGYGYKITEGNTSFVLLTDNELEFDHKGRRETYEYVNFCKGADVLFHDAQYTPKEYEKYKSFGHSSFTDAIKLAVKAKVKKLGLVHHDPDHKDSDMDKIEKVSREYIEAMNSSVQCNVIKEKDEILI